MTERCRCGVSDPGRRKMVGMMRWHSIALALIFLVVACDGKTAESTPLKGQTVARAIAAATTPEAQLIPANKIMTPPPGLTPAAPAPDTELSPGDLLLVFGRETTARYLVREQLARRNLPNDAIGETTDVLGSIMLGSDGGIVSQSSKITVDFLTLRSDEPRRDQYLQNNALESSKYPKGVFAVREIVGLPRPWPIIGDATFQLTGDMTIHGVSRPLSWDVVATFHDNHVVGQAKTRFTFDEFGISVPSLFFILSVDNDIRLELDFVAEVITGN